MSAMPKELEALDALEAVGVILTAIGAAGEELEGLIGLETVFAYLGRVVTNSTEAIRKTVESNN